MRRLLVFSVILLACLAAIPLEINESIPVEYAYLIHNDGEVVPVEMAVMCVEWVTPRSIEELLELSNLVIIGEGVTPDGYPADYRGFTHMVRVESVYLKPAWFSENEVYVDQFGAEVSNPYFPGIRVGEKSVMLLSAKQREGSAAIYHLPGPAWRFVIQDNRVYSLNWAYPTPETYIGLYYPVKGKSLQNFLIEITARIPAIAA